MPAPELPILDIGTARAWGTWLRKNHASSTGVRLRFLKKGSAEPDSIHYATALDEALCWGWIDGQLQRGDAESYLQRFTPRRQKSTWSKINCGHVARLVKEKRMQPPGLAAVAAAKQNGSWERAYSSPSQAALPEDFKRLLRTDAKAEAFFQTLNAANRYAIVYQLETAKKQETRERRQQKLFAMLQRGEKLH